MALDRFIEKDGKKLRYGYTTGSCATAAAKGAAMMLLGQKDVAEVNIDTPKGWRLTLELFDREFDSVGATCSVIKDAGDDPDVTHGVRVFATVQLSIEPGVVFKGGIGVGKVTLPGLSVPVGEPAINPVPRQMMQKELAEVAGAFNYSGGFIVTIAIPQGVKIAERTFNPKLGIIGGLSVVGTSGIVEPMSENALMASMKLELGVLKNKGFDDIIFVPGNYGRDFADSLFLDRERMVKVSNYVGFMFEESERLMFKRILFIGHLGKMVKVAGGLFNTHSHVCDGRMEILAANAAWLGGSRKLVDDIMRATTTDDAVKYILAADIPGYFDHLAERAKMRCEDKVFGNITVEIIIFSKEYGLLGASEGAMALTETLKK